MKQIIILLLLIAVPLFAQTIDTGNGIIISTNTEISPEMIVENINIGKTIIEKWENAVSVLTQTTNKFATFVTLLPNLLLLLATSIILIGVVWQNS